MKEDPHELCSSLFEKVCDFGRLYEAFDAVYKNRGAAGVDGVSVKEFKSRLDEELTELSTELGEYRYKPQPVMRVRIPKPDGGERMLGVPCVRDRVVQTAMKSVLEPIFESNFSESSYGFRPGRNQRQAIEAAESIVTSGKKWVVDIDLSKFFDRIHHNRLIHLMSKQISDKRILRLTGMFLRAGVMDNGLVCASTEGSPQGGPLSPLLSNIVLDELDKELESRGLKFCRYADDCNIFVVSEAAAERVMKSVCRFIEKKLKLVVNEDKSQTAPCDRVKFLGMTITREGSRAISKKSMNRAMAKTVELTPRGSHQNLEMTMKRINQWYVGWSHYYKMTHYPKQLESIEAHIRRRLRARVIANQKRQLHLARHLIKRGVRRKTAFKTVYTNRNRWALSHTRALEIAYPNKWFEQTLGFKIMSSRYELEPEWSHRANKWIRLP